MLGGLIERDLIYNVGLEGRGFLLERGLNREGI